MRLTLCLVAGCLAAVCFAFGINWLAGTYRAFVLKKPFRLWCFRRGFIFLTYTLWGIAFLLCGGAQVWGHLFPYALSFAGMSEILMTFAPCSEDRFNKVLYLRIIRAVVSVGVGCILIYFGTMMNHRPEICKALSLFY